MATGKKYIARFADVTGEFIAYSPIVMDGFRKIINGGLGDLVIQLPLRFAEAYQNAMVTLFNQVEIYVDEQLIYSGFIAGIRPRIGGGQENVIVVCRGHASRFAFLPLKDGTTTEMKTDTTLGLKTGGSASAASLDLVLKAIIDQYNAEAEYSIINYATGSVASSAKTWTYTLTTKSILYAIEKTMENAPSGWYWRVGADNIFRFQNKNSTPDILINFATQVSALEDAQLIDGLVNRVYFAYDGAPPTAAKVYSDTTSSDRYGDWWFFKTDGRYSVTTQVDNVGNELINSRKNPVRRVSIVLPDSGGSRKSGYDIESIEPGMTLRINNLPEATAQVMPSLFQVVAIDYSPDSARLELETYIDDLAREVAKKERADAQEATNDTPTTYTT